MSPVPLAPGERDLDPELAPPVVHPWHPEDGPELTPKGVALYSLEEKLADVRRLLVHAARTRSAP